MQKITPFLWFNDQAEEAVNFYVSIFNNSRIVDISTYGENGPGTPGSVLVASFQLEGQDFRAMNGGPMFTFSPAISLAIDCQDQAEVDRLWSRLAEGGEEQMCGWVKDKYGVSWQVVPNILLKLMDDPDPVKAGRVMQAMLQMRKIDIAKLQGAYAA